MAGRPETDVWYRGRVAFRTGAEHDVTISLKWEEDVSTHGWEAEVLEFHPAPTQTDFDMSDVEVHIFGPAPTWRKVEAHVPDGYVFAILRDDYGVHVLIAVPDGEDAE